MSNNAIRVGAISHLSHSHILSAIQLTKLAHKAELDFKTGKMIDVANYYSHRAFITGTIMLCVSFIEARINELVFDTKINLFSGNIHKKNKSYKKSLGNVVQIEGIKHLRSLEKYQLFLSLSDGQVFDTGKSPYQDVNLLVSFRNRLVHFEPEIQWKNEDHQFLKKFKSKKLPVNPFSQNSIFPDIVLGFGFAKWSIISSIKFVSEFDSKLGIDSNFPDFIKMLP